MSPSWTLIARDFRAFKKLEWSPEGVCLLAGPNGAGKSTTLGALRFLSTASRHGVTRAVSAIGGAAHLRRMGAPGDAPVSIGISVDGLTWELLLPVAGDGLDHRCGETVQRGVEVLGHRAMYSDKVFLGTEERSADERTVLQSLWDRDRPESLKPLIDWMTNIHVYFDFWFNQVLTPQPANADSFLNNHGTNVWSVLRNWKAAARKYRDQARWVELALRRAFPDLVETLEFETEGQTIAPRRYAPDSEAALPFYLGPDGLLQGVLLLVAVAGARDGSVIAIDEMENFLHPHAIRSILASVREMAEERALTVLLTTHSTVLMNEFKGHEDQFYILEPGQDSQPMALDKAEDPSWLAHFALGDLYDRERFAAPKDAQAPATPTEE